MARSETPSTIRLRICALRTIGSLFTSPNVIHHAVHVKKKLDFVLTTAIQPALRYDQNQHLRNEGEQLNIMLSSKKKPLSPLDCGCCWRRRWIRAGLENYRTRMWIVHTGISVTTTFSTA